jgi:hypothetical protein
MPSRLDDVNFVRLLGNEEPTMINLPAIEADLYRILNACTLPEILHMRTNLVAGRINGETYFPTSTTPGCSCLVGAILEYQGISLCKAFRDNLGFYVDPYSPIEYYVKNVLPSETPATCPELANVLSWIDAYLTAHYRFIDLQADINDELLWAIVVADNE